jgi:uncharacterized membrane protein
MRKTSVTAIVEHTYRRTINPFHAVFLAGTIPLFLGALLSDLGYWSSYHVQWKNFSSWLIAGGLTFGALALLSAIIGLLSAAGRGRGLFYILLLVVMWILGFINAVVHAKDAWASQPMGLVLSVIVTLLACVATGIGFSVRRAGAVK